MLSLEEWLARVPDDVRAEKDVHSITQKENQLLKDRVAEMKCDSNEDYKVLRGSPWVEYHTNMDIVDLKGEGVGVEDDKGEWNGKKSDEIAVNKSSEVGSGDGAAPQDLVEDIVDHLEGETCGDDLDMVISDVEGDVGHNHTSNIVTYLKKNPRI